MAVIKLSKSGKALLFIDESEPISNVFIIPIWMVKSLLNNDYKQSMVYLKRFPDGLDCTRFQKSQVIGVSQGDVSGLRDDAFGRLKVSKDEFDFSKFDNYEV